MAKFDMTFPTSLQAACLEAERRIDRDIATVLRSATFLQEVADSTARERETEAFLRRIWNENPLYKLSTGSNSMDIATALTDAAFRQWFRELIDGPYPENPQERAAWLDDLMNKTKRRIWPNSPGSNVKTTRAFAALFPHDFTTHRSPGRKGGLYEVLSGAKNVRDEARVNRWILDRLDEAIGSVDRTDFNAVARRMMLPEILHEIFGAASTFRTSAYCFLPRSGAISHLAPTSADRQALQVPTGGREAHLRPRSRGVPPSRHLSARAAAFCGAHGAQRNR